MAKRAAINRIMKREEAIEINLHYMLGIYDSLNASQKRLVDELIGEVEEIAKDGEYSQELGTFQHATFEFLVGEKKFDFVAMRSSREYHRRVMYDCEFYPCENGEKSAHICSTRNYLHCMGRRKLLEAAKKQAKT